MIKQTILKELFKLLGRENVLCSMKDLIAYSYDATQHQIIPDLVVFPSNSNDVSEVVKIAYREKIPVIPRGAGTGISGGTVPVNGGIVLELSKMNKIIGIDVFSRTAVVEPGVVNLDLQDALASLRFMFPPDPASQKSCTLGGNIGENAGGPLCFKYGVTSKYVKGMEVVLPDGEIFEFGGKTEDNPGYDLRGLFIGSEGTLGIATKLTLSIVPLPEASKTILAIFETLESAGQSVSDIINAGIIPTSLELMDKMMCKAIEQSLHAGYPTDADGVLLIEISGLNDSMDRQVQSISLICQKNNVRELRKAKTSIERDNLWKGRKGAFGSVARICPPYLVNDGTVPRNKIVQALLSVQEISHKYNVRIANVAHAGDGNLHPLILFDQHNQEEVKNAKKAAEEILDMCIALGGTISGEHGIGTEKLMAMTRMFSPSDISAMRLVKYVFDPENILNKGKLLPPEVDQIKLGQVTKTSTTGDLSQDIFDILTKIVGASNVKIGEQITSVDQVDGVVPKTVVIASTTDQVSQIIKTANQFQQIVIPLGGGSKISCGRCIKTGDIILDVKKLNQITDLDQGNSTVRVGAGKVNSELQREMAKYKLFCPLDTIYSETSTIGGEIAAGDNGPGRFMYGNIRDLVLGLTIVTPNGEIVHLGGKTIKNVAGLDLCKLYVGSWGTLGVITEAVIRLFPLPENRQSLCLVLNDIDKCLGLISRILNSVLTPGAIDLLDATASHFLGSNPLPSLCNEQFFLIINLEGSKDIVDRHIKEINILAQNVDLIDKILVDTDKYFSVWKAYHEMEPKFLRENPSGLKGKISIPLNKSLEMFHSLETIRTDFGIRIGVRGHCGNGIYYLYIPSGNYNPYRLIDELKKSAISLGGFFILEKGPLEIRKNNLIWTGSSDDKLMKNLKRAFDPNDIINPGKVFSE